MPASQRTNFDLSRWTTAMRTWSFRRIATVSFLLQALTIAGTGRAVASALITGTALPAPSGADSTLESVLPRDGLQVYFEVRGEGLSQLAKLAVGASQAGNNKPGGLSVKDLSGFALAHLALLARARIALVTYAGAGFAIAIETANSDEARHLADDLARSLNRAQSRARTTGSASGPDKQSDTAGPGPSDNLRIGSADAGRGDIAGAKSAMA